MLPRGRRAKRTADAGVWRGPNCQVPARDGEPTGVATMATWIPRGSRPGDHATTLGHENGADSSRRLRHILTDRGFGCYASLIPAAPFGSGAPCATS
jgi:hypothetical protein